MNARFALLIAEGLLCASAAGQVTQRVSVNSSGVQANGDTSDPSISADGRYVAFYGNASNLVSGDTNGVRDVFVRDRLAGTTERVSVSSEGVQGDLDSYDPRITPDGRFVAFWSLATNLVPLDTNGFSDVFVYDRQTRTTERISISSTGEEGNAQSSGASISADGRYVAFASTASNLVSGDTNQTFDLFVRDRLAGTTERINVSSEGAQANQFCYDPVISADGRYVAFDSYATNLVPNDTDYVLNVFLRDRQSGTTERISLTIGGVPSNGDSAFPSISADGRFVAFRSLDSNLVPGDTNGVADLFVFDRSLQTTERVSVDSHGMQGNAQSFLANISADGRYVAFGSYATNLVVGDTNELEDAFVHDRQLGTTERINVSSSGTEANGLGTYPVITADGRYVGFYGPATNMVPGDTNGAYDTFLRDRFGGPNFVSLCSPGVAGVSDCPCSNPPSGSNQGCDNSATTGGATLSASGGTFLSSDSLAFRTSGEKPHALSVLMQGNGVVSNGHVYGQGVRCLGGTIIRRLLTKQAVNGSVTLPDTDAGDPSVATRSAAKGDMIQAGDSRYYLVYYRDPIVLGGCPVSSTFNCTQTGMVTWSP